MVKDLENTYNYPLVANIRIGEKEGKRPKGLNYFTAHEDKHTDLHIVEFFKEHFGEKPKEITINFLVDEPFETDYLRYGKSGLLCKGDGEKASFKDEEDWTECECSKECEYRGNDCKLTGKLHFVIKDVDVGGIWRFQTKSYNTIMNINRTLNYLKYMNVDIKNNDFRLSVEEQTSIVNGKVQKYNVVKLKLIVNNQTKKQLENKEEKSKKEQVVNNKPKKQLECEKETDNIKTDVSQKDSEQSKEKSENISSRENHEKESREEQIDNNENIVILYDLHDLTKGEKVVKEANFCNMNDELITVLIHPSIVDEVNKWQESSAIIPTIEKQGKYNVLTGYKDVGILKKAI